MNPESLKGPCDECGSLFLALVTKMAGLCAECAHQLYGYPACAHAFADGRCGQCGWDGSVSALLVGGADTEPFDPH